MAYTPDQLQVMDAIIKRYPRSRSAIMPLLHYVQSIAGYITNEGIELVAKLLTLDHLQCPHHFRDRAKFVPTTKCLRDKVCTYRKIRAYKIRSNAILREPRK